MEKTEAKIQQEIFTYHWNNYPEQRGWLFMVYNNPRNEISGNHLRSQGMVKGVADMILLRPSLPPMFLEIKNEKGRQSLAQRDWEFTVDNNDLGDYALVRSLEHAKEVCGWNR